MAERAEALQAAHTARRNTVANIRRRLSATRQGNKPETWLFPDLRGKDNLIPHAPARLDTEKKREWAEQRYSRDLTACYDAITARLRPGSSLTAGFADGELSFMIDAVPVVNRIFVSADEGEFILAQWKVLAATLAITEKTDGKKLVNGLRKLAIVDNPAIVEQIISLERELSRLEADIAQQEGEINSLIYRLYDLSENDIALIKKDRRAR